MLEKVYLHSTSSLGNFPIVFLLNIFNVGVIDDGAISSFQGRLFTVSSLYASLLRLIDGVMFLASSLQLVPPKTRRFRLLKTKADCGGWNSRQFICSVVLLDDVQHVIVKELSSTGVSDDVEPCHMTTWSSYSTFTFF